MQNRYFIDCGASRSNNICSGKCITITFLFGLPLQGKGFTVILGKILTALSLPIPAVSIALILLLSSSISFIASPFAGMVLMTAKFLNVKPMEVAVTWNAGYCVLFLAEGILFACLWG